MLLKKGNVSLGQNKEALSPRAKFSRSTLIFMTIFAILASLASLTGGILANTWPFFLLSGAFHLLLRPVLSHLHTVHPLR